MVENDEKVEILGISENDEMVVQNETHIHEMVEKVVIDEIDIFDEIDIEYEAEHMTLHEPVENEYYMVELVDVQIEVCLDDPVETQ